MNSKNIKRHLNGKLRDWPKSIDDETDVSALIRLKQAHKRCQLTRHQYRTLYGQVLAGEAEGAMKGLQRLLNEHRLTVPETKNQCFTGNSKRSKT